MYTFLIMFVFVDFNIVFVFVFFLIWSSASARPRTNSFEGAQSTYPWKFLLKALWYHTNLKQWILCCRSHPNQPYEYSLPGSGIVTSNPELPKSVAVEATTGLQGLGWWSCIAVWHIGVTRFPVIEFTLVCQIYQWYNLCTCVHPSLASVLFRLFIRTSRRDNGLLIRMQSRPGQLSDLLSKTSHYSSTPEFHPPPPLQ